MLAIRLPPAIEKRLEDLAKKTGRTKTFYAREAILNHVEELEDKYLALRRLKNPVKRWTQSELEKDLDLEG
jgi:RHH-type transcriptional regulator, rel operon repressor / antitoxin RelB